MPSISGRECVGLRKPRAATYANFTGLDEGRGRESRGMGESPQRPPKVKGLREHPESLRQKDRGPEGVLESPASHG